VLEQANWLKIRNQEYFQWFGREELFERERGGDPECGVWFGYEHRTTTVLLQSNRLAEAE